MIIKTLIKTILFIVEKIIAELAIFAALFSITQQGSYVERMFGGIMVVVRFIISSIEAYIQNAGIRDILNGIGAELMKAIGQAVDNIQTDSQMVLYSLILTFVACKLIAALIALIRRRIRVRKKNDNKKTPKANPLENITSSGTPVTSSDRTVVGSESLPE